VRVGRERQGPLRCASRECYGQLHATMSKSLALRAMALSKWAICSGSFKPEPSEAKGG